MSTTPEYPTIGRIVHQVGRGSADGAFPPVCRAAIVTAVPTVPLPDGAIDLFVMPPRGTFHDDAVPYHPGSAGLGDGTANAAVCASGARTYPGGTWHWPERLTGERA